ncbi:MAG: metallophosphoesterase [Myxococcota bacterium]|nr:metallophosphoesterase [Myxococcota bacterium]
MLRALGFFVFVFGFMALPAVLLRWGFREAWSKWLGAVVFSGYALALVLSGLFALNRVDAPGFAWYSVMGANTILVAGLAVIASAFVWGPILWWMRRQTQAESTVNLARRRVLMGATQAVPALSVMMSPAGVRAAMKDPIVRRVSIPIRDLPPGLEGLRILQLTDVHFGVHIEATQFEKIVRVAREYAPDMVVLTGDIADDYSKLGPALRYLKELETPLGVFACIGNHEIYRGRAEAEKIYAEHGVHYLCNDGTLIERGGDSFWLAGADDPARLFRDRGSFFTRTVKAALSGCPDDVSTQVLLCHRPRGFDAAAELGVSLTLSGHTHGGQVAFAGRSLFEPLMPSRYLLGHYQRGESHLYTSAGLGHWLPFRLNCPCEGALIELSRATA